MDEAPQIPARLPVWKTVGSCYRALWNRQISQMPFIWVIVALGILDHWTQFKIFGSVTRPEEYIQAFRQSSLMLKIFLLGGFVLYTILITTLVVSWVRYVVRGERPLGAYVGPAFWKYLVMTFLVMIVGAVVLIASLKAIGWISRSMIHLENHQALILGVVTLAIVCIIIFWLCLRLGLKFTAIALSDASLTWQAAYVRMRRNVLRLFCCTILVNFPFLAASALIGMLWQAFGWSTLDGRMTNGAIMGAMAIYQTIALATLMGITYRTLVGTHLHLQQPTEPQASS